VMRMPEVRARVQAFGAIPIGDSSADFANFMTKERTRLGDVIAKTGVVLTE
jgi:hypothetical protein